MLHSALGFGCRVSALGNFSTLSSKVGAKSLLQSFPDFDERVETWPSLCCRVSDHFLRQSLDSSEWILGFTLVAITLSIIHHLH